MAAAAVCARLRLAATQEGAEALSRKRPAGEVGDAAREGYGPRPPRFHAIDRKNVETVPAGERKSRVHVRDEGRSVAAGASVAELIDSLPDQLAGADFRAVIRAWSTAWQEDRTVLFGFGAHLIKVGLAPLVIDLMERGAINALMMNGAGCVHDLELSMLGHTSEDVAAGIDDGSFGMAAEPTRRLNEAIARGHADGLGMGEAVGRDILESADPYKDRSVLANAHRLGLPVTVHVAIGTDIHHMHAEADGAAMGATSQRDFDRLTGIVAALDHGVLFNVGSAVILPEVFLKALTLARNLGHPVSDITTVNLDFLRHYRPRVNVVERPTQSSGSGYALVGHHELMLPLLAAGVLEARAGRLS
jgi:deoxyhypusine synthase